MTQHSEHIITLFFPKYENLSSWLQQHYTELSVLISTFTGNTNNSEWINSKSTMVTKIQAEINVKKEILPLEEQVPKEFHGYLDVFSEEKAARFPEPRTWDHKIKMKEGFIHTQILQNIQLNSTGTD